MPPDRAVRNTVAAISPLAGGENAKPPQSAFQASALELNRVRPTLELNFATAPDKLAVRLFG